MSRLFSGYGATSRRPSIALSSRDIDEGAPAGTRVGTLSLPGPGWTATLVGTAGGMFALEGRDLVVGSTPPNRLTLPAPKLLVAASDGTAATAELFAIDVRRALPALPLPVGARVAAIGDSYVGYNNCFGTPVGTGGGSVRAAISTGYGFVKLAEAHDPRFRFESWYDPADPRGLNYSGASQGLHGDHLDWAQAGFGGGILARLPVLLARRPDILVIEGGINSISTGDDGREGNPAYVAAKLDAMLRLTRSAGVWAILMTIFPRGDWIAAGDPKHAMVEAANTWIRAQAGREGVLAVLDADPLLRPEGTFDASLFRADRLHLSPRGALALARSNLLPILQGAIQAGSTFERDPGVGNLFPASVHTMAGVGGTRQFSGVTNAAKAPTGPIASGYTLNIGRNASVVASKELMAGGLEAQVMAITPGGTENGAYAELTLSGMVAMEPATPGQWYQASIEVETSGDGLTFASLHGGLRDAANGVVTETAALTRESSVDFAAPTGGGARTFWLQTEPFQAPEGSAADKLTFRLLMTFSKSAAPFTVKARKPIARRIPDPRPAWGG